ncbi:choice-of-anchor L domain-containing protein [Winogradskyella poriferorum]|uniref:choice-of-anchor L domain-containing protein n=1 Tax=Winogradskyella poriferorum TaxID=307627 RepID=UPI003D64E615
MLKKRILPFLMGALCVLFSHAQQISTDDSLPLEQLIENNFGQNCVEISNISSSVNGNVNGFSSFGFFERGNSNFPFENGIVLTTGNVLSAGNSINTNPLNEGDDDWGTDIDLENALGISETLNATSIDFNFVSVANQIEFNYILASEEYQQEYPCYYSDGFAFLIRQAGTNEEFTNIALIPGTNIPVNTSTIHEQILGAAGCPAENEQYFEGYNVGDTNYNGRTVVLTATATIIPNVEYEIKLVIADQTDENFDSAVFIEGNSFNASVDLGPDITTCGDSVLLNGNINNPQASYEWYQDGLLIDGASNPTYEAVESGTYDVVITIQLNQTSCVISDEIEIALSSEQEVSNISDFILCDDDSNDGVEAFNLESKNYEVLTTVPPSSYSISYHLSEDDAQNNQNPVASPYDNTSSPQQIFVRIEDTVNGCLAFSSFNLIVNAKPEATEPDPIIACPDPTLDGYTFIDLTVANDQITNGNANQYVTYHYSQPEADNGWNPIFSPYLNYNTSETLFVRVYDATTGCFSTTTIDVQFQETPAINTENQWINACEQDFDGFETFDLTSVIDNILQGLTGLELSFHEYYNDALTGVNEITDPENYANIVPNFQIIYVRVFDPTTGCFTITQIELHSNIIQTTFDLEAFIVCDDPSNDGIEEFDLEAVETELEDGYSEFETTFYLTEDDRDNEVNAIDETVPFVVTDNGTEIFATVVSDVCIEYVTVTLEIAPALILEPQTADYCDENTDGFTTLIMDTFNTVSAQGVQAANVKYYYTEEDALNDVNDLPDYVYNSANPQLFYIRVTNTQSGCYDVTTLTVNIVSAPQITYPNPIIVCDDDNDGISIVNLEEKIPELTPEVDTSNITFYSDYWNAVNGENELTNLVDYETASTYIYARIENESTGCYSLSGFYIYINTLPEFIPITNFENCEADISGVADFYFYLKDAEILNGQPNKQVLYYETEEDAEAGTNPINKYAPYQNTSSPQTIYVRVENLTDSTCYGTSSFELEVGSLPIFNPASDIFVCDDISNDGFVTVDLNATIEEMVLGSPEILEITFYTSQYDADNSINEVPLEYTNSVNPQQLFARVDNGNYCYGVSAFAINIISAPIVNMPNPVERCDDDYDGILTWDLTISEIEILDVRQDNIEVSYFTSLEDAEADLNAIADPENFDNTTSPQTVYVKVNNTISNCFVTLPLEITVNPLPVINDFEFVEICDNVDQSFDLSTIDDLVIDDFNDINISYHNNQSDADNDLNPLDLNYIYSQFTHTIIIRVEYQTTGCFVTYPFQLIINPLPTAHPVSNLETCDDVSNDEFEIFDLLSQNQFVLQNQDPSIFTVSYHSTFEDANNGVSALEDNYNSENNETIFVRVTNSITGCYDITQFDTIVYPAPSSVSPITICDNDYDGLNTFNLTQSESELYPSIPDNVLISYFVSIENLESDTNPINTPENYTNTSNPQTVYLKVLNTSANCYTVVDLELNTTLPPPINEFEIYEICDNPDSYFDLNEIETVISDDTTNVIFTYFNSYVDAENNINAIGTDYTYTTINDIIFIKIEDANTSCFYIYDFTLQINPLPIANPLENIEVCDDSSNDNVEIFNLSPQTPILLGDQDPNMFTVSYHSNETDAINDENAISTNYSASSNQQIVARIENNETGCFSLTDFLLIINPHPFEPQPLINCDDDYDGITTFDLTLAEGDLFEIDNPNNIITYFESLDELENDLNPIVDPANYTNLTYPQTVYIKVFNTVANCFTHVPLELNVFLPPAINDFQFYEICENENNFFDLNTINDVIVDVDFNVLFSYFETASDAEANMNSLNTDYTYSSDNDIIYVRVEFSTTHCYYVYPFELIILPNPIANQPQNIEYCDDDFDGFLDADISQQTASILGVLDNTSYTVTYFNSVEEATDGVNYIENLTNYNAYNNETIIARLENNITDCFDLVEFSVIIHPLPIIDIPDQVICLDNLPLIVSANTNVGNDEYLWSTGATSPEIQIDEIGTYWVTVTTEFGCENTHVFNVSESEAAMIEFTETVDFSDPNNITITVSGIGDYLYQLDDFEPQESNIFENVALGYHTITIIDLNGCAEVTTEVIVIDAPKHMTPNNDGDFDTWHIIGIETLPGSIVYIFDRYGKLLKQLGSSTPGWDGTYNGHKMPATDYWYVAKIQQGSEAFEVKGHFTLRR